MLDVHAPHDAVRTWKDFFIHIAAIAVGLLIAIGLEQTVEYFTTAIKWRRLARPFGSNANKTICASPTRPWSFAPVFQ